MKVVYSISRKDIPVRYGRKRLFTLLRATLTCHSLKLVLLKTNMGAGHGGASGRYDYLKEVAFKFAFILNIISGEGLN